MKHTVTLTLDDQDYQFLSQLAEASLRTRPGMVRRFLHLYQDALEKGHASDTDFGVIFQHVPDSAWMAKQARSVGVFQAKILEFPKVAGHE